MPIAEARALMTFPTEREIVERALSTGARHLMQQTALIEEHRAARRPTGRFCWLGDARPIRGHPRGASGGARARRPVRPVAHGRVWVTGPDAGAALAYALVTDPPRLAVGRAHYSMIMRRRRRHHRRPDRLPAAPKTASWSCPMPPTARRSAAALRERLAGFDATLDDASLRTSLVAIQGPLPRGHPGAADDGRSGAAQVLRHRGWIAWPACRRLVARTGYTGEDGFEIFVDWDEAVPLWDALLAAGDRQRPGALRPGRARHAAAGGGHAAVRQRA